jgi:hypothetical protein
MTMSEKSKREPFVDLATEMDKQRPPQLCPMSARDAATIIGALQLWVSAECDRSRNMRKMLLGESAGKILEILGVHDGPGTKALVDRLAKFQTEAFAPPPEKKEGGS